MFGYTRETAILAQKSGNDPVTGIARTGLDEYLRVIFPSTRDWVHDRTVAGATRRIRPDFRSDELGLVVEFDGVPHYSSAARIASDRANSAEYERLGYRVVRVPFFIVLSRSAINTLFGVDCDTELLSDDVPTLTGGVIERICLAGAHRMCAEFARFPEQWQANLRYLQTHDPQNAQVLEMIYQNLRNLKA